MLSTYNSTIPYLCLPLFLLGSSARSLGTSQLSLQLHATCLGLGKLQRNVSNCWF